jgi:hypothetical protein
VSREVSDKRCFPFFFTEEIVMNNSIKLARLWAQLNDIKDQIDNEIIPVAGYLGVEDPSLMIALEELSAKIENHFETFRLVAEVNKR